MRLYCDKLLAYNAPFCIAYDCYDMSKLIVGLGNPGSKYASTLHNVGFMVLDEILQTYGSSGSFDKKFDGEHSSCVVGGKKAHLLKPMSFMNRSGVPVQKCISFYKMSAEDLIVIYDDADLEPGRVKCKVGGGSGGHNGIKSIDSMVGKEYLRIRVGIGRPTHGPEDLANYVLSSMSGELEQSIMRAVKDVSANIDYVLCEQYDMFMSKIAGQ